MIESRNCKNLWKSSTTSRWNRENQGGHSSVTTADGFWTGKTVLVTGGVSFIGSTLTDQLLARSVKNVRIVDDLRSGHLDKIRRRLGTAQGDFLQADLREPPVTRAAMQSVGTVFHLAG